MEPGMGTRRDALPRPPPLRELIWEAPLVPVGFAATAGLLLDRYVGLPIVAWGLGLVAAFSAWGKLFRKNSPRAVVALWVAAGFLAGGYHHYHCNLFPSDDVGNFAADE